MLAAVAVALFLTPVALAEDASEVAMLQITRFYTVSYGGEVKRAYESLASQPAQERDGEGRSVRVPDAPPPVTVFHPGDVLCVAMQSAPGEFWTRHFQGRAFNERLTGIATVQIRTASTGSLHFGFPYRGNAPDLEIGGNGGWSVSCVRLQVSADDGGPSDAVYRHPETHLSPGPHAAHATPYDSAGHGYGQVDALFTVE